MRQSTGFQPAESSAATVFCSHKHLQTFITKSLEWSVTIQSHLNMSVVKGACLSADSLFNTSYTLQHVTSSKPQSDKMGSFFVVPAGQSRKLAACHLLDFSLFSTQGLYWEKWVELKLQGFVLLSFCVQMYWLLMGHTGSTPSTDAWVPVPAHLLTDLTSQRYNYKKLSPALLHTYLKWAIF